MRWGQCIAIVIAVVALSGAKPKEAQPEPNPASQNEVARSLENVAAALKQPSEPAKYQQPCDEGSKERASDLCAQWYAADAARSAATAAWIVGFVGAFIAFLTLGAAWKAAVYAKLAAEETKRTADFAALTTAADLRPYLFVSKIIPKICGEGLYNFEVVFQNYGKLPARSIVVQSDACYTASPEFISCGVLSVEKVEIPVCAPGHERRVFEDILLNEEERKAFDAGFGSVIIRVRYRYRGGPRKRPYAERVDYAYRAKSAETGHVYIVTPNVRRRKRAHLLELMEQTERSARGDNNTEDEG